MSGFITVLDQLKGNTPVFEERIKTITQYYHERLWHDLTGELKTLLGTLAYEVGIKIYDEMIKDFELKLNYISLAQIMTAITRKNKDKKNCIIKLQELSDRIVAKEKVKGEANYFLDCEIAYNHLRLAQHVLLTSGSQIRQDKTLANKFEAYQKNAKILLNDAGAFIKNTAIVPLELTAKYHQVRAELMKLQHNLKEYFSEALLYLAYVQGNMPASEQKKMAYDLSIAALTGEIYHLGELIHHPILGALNNTPFEWLSELLKVFHNGDIAGYQRMEAAGLLDKAPILKSKQAFLHKKLQLMSLLNLIFSYIPEQRVLAFADIQAHTKVADVELLLLKALSLNLIKGLIDEIQQTVYISWCQPKVLNKRELGNLRNKVTLWHERVTTAEKFVKLQQQIA